jgi:hypothetical protein
METLPTDRNGSEKILINELVHSMDNIDIEGY